MISSPPDRALARQILFLVPLAAMMVNMGQSVLFATLPMLGRQLQFSEVQVTALISLSALTYFLTSPYWGRYSDTVGRKKVILLGLFGYFVGTLIFNTIVTLGFMGILVGIWLYMCLLPYRVLHTGLMAATHPASGAYIADVTSVQERAGGMALIAAAIALGAMMGPVFVYFARFDLLLPLYITAVLCLLTFLLLLWRLPDYRIQSSLGGKGGGLRLRYLDPRYRGLLLIGLIMYAAMALVQQTLGFYFQDRLNLSALDAIQSFAFANMLSSVAMLFSQLLLVRKLGWRPRLLLRVGLPLSALGYMGLALGGTLWEFYLSMMLFGLGMGTAGPGYSASASLRVSRHEQGALAGLAGSIPGLGFVIGPLAGGLLYQQNPQWPFYGASLLMILLSVGYIWHSILAPAEIPPVEEPVTPPG